MMLLSRELLFRVEGVPAPQGSKTAFVVRGGGKAVLVEANKRLPEWRRLVSEAARLALYESDVVEPFVKPVRLTVSFFMPKPAKPVHEVFPGSKPDLDHLIRAVGDSLTTAGVLKDDSLIVEVLARKLWCGVSTDTYPEPGCLVKVTEL